jgi:tetratricopeptide (TPR) repeat protein
LGQAIITVTKNQLIRLGVGVVFRQAYKGRPDMNEKRIETILKLIASGKLNEALNLADTHDIESLFEIGVSFIGKGANDAAEKVFDRITQLAPYDIAAWLNKGAALNSRGRHEEALQACDKALELNPRADQAWYNKGIALIKLGRYEEALRACDKALELNPNLAEPHANRGIIFIYQHAYGASVDDLREASNL